MGTRGKNKVIRLLFDEWKPRYPIPNAGFSAGNAEFNYPQGLINFYERFYHEQLGFQLKSLPCKSFRLSEIESDKEYYYVIKTVLGFSELVPNYDFKLSQEVIDVLINKPNVYFLFVREHESETKEDFDYLVDYFQSKFIPLDKIILLSNNTLLEDKCKSLNIRFHKLNLLSLTSSSVFTALGSTFIEDKTGKFFISYNKTPKLHRYGLLIWLHYYNLLNDIDWSLIGKSNIDNGMLSNIFFDEDLKNLQPSIEFFNQLETKYSIAEENTNWINPKTLEISQSVRKPLDGSAGASGGLMLPEPVDSYLQSYLNLVTESFFEDDLESIHVTEKSFRPFFFYQIPLILGSQHHIKYMKEEYGFDFYDDIIDHSYDNEPNQTKRLKMFSEEVFRLSNQKNEIKLFYKENKNRFEKNKQIVVNLPNDTKDFYFFKSLIS